MKLSYIVANGFKNIIKFSIFIICIFISCNKNSVIRNPFLPELDFEFSINLNLPLYNNLKFTGGSILIDNFGHKGIIIYTLNNNNYLAWEASCPNEKPSNCSTMEIQGLQAECKCNSNLYSLANGQPLKINTSNSYPMVAYFTQKSGNSLRIYN